MTTGTHEYEHDPRNADILSHVGGKLVPRAEVLADPLAPARQGRGIKRQSMLKERLTAEVLPIWVLGPAGHHHLVPVHHETTLDPSFVGPGPHPRRIRSLLRRSRGAPSVVTRSRAMTAPLSGSV